MGVLIWASFSGAKRIIEQTKPSDEELQGILDSYANYNANYPNGIYVADSTGNVMKDRKDLQHIRRTPESKMKEAKAEEKK